jgi:hypothetical protein
LEASEYGLTAGERLLGLQVDGKEILTRGSRGELQPHVVDEVERFGAQLRSRRDVSVV